MWKYYEIYCVSITIYAGSYKYLKEKKSTNRRQKKKAVAIIATVPLEQPKWHCSTCSKPKKKKNLKRKKRRRKKDKDSINQMCIVEFIKCT